MDKLLQLTVLPQEVILLEWVVPERPLTPETLRIQDEVYGRYQANDDLWLLYLGFCNQHVYLSPSLDFFRSFMTGFARKIRLAPDLEGFRQKVTIGLDEDEWQYYSESVPLMAGSEYVHREFLVSCWKRVLQAFKEAIRSYNGEVRDYIRSFCPDIHLVGRVFFHLVENKGNELPFAFLATYSTGEGETKRSKHLPLKYALEEYAHDSQKLLELLGTVHEAAKESEFINELLGSGEIFHPLAWTSQEAFTFLSEIPLYENAGILCRIPAWWKGKASKSNVGLSVAEKRPSQLGLEAIVNFRLHLAIGDTEITEEEARQLLQQSEGLAFIKNKWVPVDPENLKKVMALYEQTRELLDKGLTLKEALHLQMHPEQLAGPDEGPGEITISRGQWLKSVTEKLLDPAKIPPVKAVAGLKATLRPYQQKGLNWLYFLNNLRFGACLADDMGLGKTLQLLGFLALISGVELRKAGPRTDLLIIPASLVNNWVSEIQRFTPSLRFIVAHPDAPANRYVEDEAGQTVDTADLVITTYTLVRKYRWIQSRSWRYIILDEAQAIKNPKTIQARTIKKLKSDNRTILTGTPIENRLLDLWSLFDFLNPGLLGTSKEFASFCKKLDKDPAGYARLRKVISPYILRRLKTDKTVIADLPEKVEMKLYSNLSKKQLLFYRQVIDGLKSTLENVEGIKRKGTVLATLMKLKQICNHPDQFLGTGEFNAADSGKFERIREICETIREKRERVLVFTQFKEVTEHLRGYLSEIFGRDGLVLHGSVPVKKRKTIIERFQGRDYVPFMVLSIKAGGVGLNLTAANHVVHFDRWWNPAVENQATDRAFRIGQKKNVLVHKCITRGTVEEKIDLMLEEKATLSKEVVATSGEGWITEMSNEDLLNIVTLSL